MKALLLVLWSLVAAAPALAQEGPPSDESLHRLMAATRADRILDAYFKQVDVGMQAGLRQALQGQAPNARQRQIIDDMRARTLAVLRQTMSWDKLEPMMHEIYRKNLTQGQVNDMLKFYESPTGRAVDDKLPVIMQQAGEAVQGLLPPMLAKVQGIMKDTAEQLKAAAGK